MLMKTFENLIEYTEHQLDKAMAEEPTYAIIHTQAAITSALMAIAQELRDANKQKLLELSEKYGYIYDYED